MPPTVRSTSAVSARAELLSARRLLGDHELPLSVIRTHLRDAWTILYEREHPDPSEHTGGRTQEELGRWAAERSPSYGGLDDDEPIVDWIFAAENALVDPDRARVAGYVERLIASDSGVPYRDPVKPIGIGFVIALIVLMGGAAVFSFVRGPTGPWRGAWFEDRDFKGASTIRYARNIDFDWKHESPMPGWPVDKWSVIWDTCLSVDDAGEYRFRTTSDDGTRLYVDEQLVVENWGARPTRTRSGKITLEAGVHHVRVEYFESSFTANVKVEAAFPEGEFGLLPIERLSRPGSDPPLCW